MTPPCPFDASECRAMAKALAEFMEWEITALSGLRWIRCQSPTMLDRDFDPFSSLDDLAPVLREIAKRGAFPLFVERLSENHEMTPEASKQSSKTMRKANMDFESYSVGLAIEWALLAPPYALARAAFETIQTKGKS